MKKILYIILPLLIFAFGANAALAQNIEIKQLSKEDRQALEQAKQTSEAKQQEKFYSEILAADTLADKSIEIIFNQRINLQTLVPYEDNKPAPIGVYKLNLNPQKDYSLVNQNNFTPINQKMISWHWNDFLGKASYKIYIVLNDKNQNDKYLLIIVEPVIEKNKKTGKALEPTIPYAYIAINKEGKDIRLSGHVYAMDDHSGFNKKIVIEK